MRLTILGSGDHAGIPRSGCDCPACTSPRRRRNTAALIEAGGLRLAIDTGCGPSPRLDALLVTHEHPDHAGRIGEFAGLCAWAPVGTSVPLPARPLAPFCTTIIGAVRVTALPLRHPVPTLGYVIENGGRRLAWLTDTYGLPDGTAAWLAAHPCDLLAIDTTFAPGTERAPIKQHGDLDLVLRTVARLPVRQVLLIHIGHEFQSWLDANRPSLPGNVAVAADGDVHEL